MILFTHGTMWSGKSLRLIDTVNKSKDFENIVVLKPIIDDRNGSFIFTRFGPTEEGTKIECNMWDPDVSLRDTISLIDDDILLHEYDMVIIDEAQFLTKKQVLEIDQISCDFPEIEFRLYGLKNTFKGELFEGVRHIIAVMDDIQELPKKCWCKSPAKQNAKVKDGEVVKYGDVEDVGYHYVPLCNKHFNMGWTKSK